MSVTRAETGRPAARLSAWLGGGSAASRPTWSIWKLPGHTWSPAARKETSIDATSSPVQSPNGTRTSFHASGLMSCVRSNATPVLSRTTTRAWYGPLGAPPYPLTWTTRALASPSGIGSASVTETVRQAFAGVLEAATPSSSRRPSRAMPGLLAMLGTEVAPVTKSPAVQPSAPCSKLCSSVKSSLRHASPAGSSSQPSPRTKADVRPRAHSWPPDEADTTMSPPGAESGVRWTGTETVRDDPAGISTTAGWVPLHPSGASSTARLTWTASCDRLATSVATSVPVSSMSSTRGTAWTSPMVTGLCTDTGSSTGTRSLVLSRTAENVPSITTSPRDCVSGTVTVKGAVTVWPGATVLGNVPWGRTPQPSGADSAAATWVEPPVRAVLHHQPGVEGAAGDGVADLLQLDGDAVEPGDERGELTSRLLQEPA